MLSRMGRNHYDENTGRPRGCIISTDVPAKTGQFATLGGRNRIVSRRMKEAIPVLVSLWDNVVI